MKRRSLGFLNRLPNKKKNKNKTKNRNKISSVMRSVRDKQNRITVTNKAISKSLKQLIWRDPDQVD